MESIAEYLRHTVPQYTTDTKEVQHHLISKWVQLLKKWNKKYNLTGKHCDIDIVNDLILDSLASLKYLRGNNIVDVGSGAGIPGMILAIYCPNKHFTLVDSVAKKTNFIEHCRICLNVHNVSVWRGRIEEFKPTVTFDTIISKAFGKVSQFVNSSHHLGDNTSLWLTYKNNIDDAEFQQLSNPKISKSLWKFDVHNYQRNDRTYHLVALTNE